MALSRRASRSGTKADDAARLPARCACAVDAVMTATTAALATPTRETERKERGRIL
jgi:hypothetical protein